MYEKSEEEKFEDAQGDCHLCAILESEDRMGKLTRFVNGSSFNPPDFYIGRDLNVLVNIIEDRRHDLIAWCKGTH